MPSSEKQLSDFKWENRLLVTFNIPAEQLKKVDQNSIKDRKLLFFQFQSKSLLFSNYEGVIDQQDFLKLSENYAADYFLIGLDGGVKAFGKKEDFSILELIKQIDSMPMRQSEIRKKKDGKN
jgi:hypothetical protein